MITPNTNGKIEIDIAAKEKMSITATVNDDSFEFDTAPSSEQKVIDLDRYLSIDNEKPYSPSGEYNPATKKYIDDIIKNFKSLNIEKVNTLEEVTDAQTIYLIPSLLVDETNCYEEYILIDGRPECLGVTKAEMAKKQNKLITGENVSIVDDVISAKGGVEPKRGEELASMEEPFSGVAFCTEGYGEEFLEGSMYEYEDGELIKTIELSGGGSGNTNQSETITPLEDNVAVGNPVFLKYNFKSKSSGKGTAKLFTNGILKSSKIISKGENSFDITELVKEGTNFFTITITDSSNSTMTFDYIINGVKLTLKTTFNENYVYNGDVSYTYAVIGAGVKTVTFILDDEEIDSIEIRSSGEQSKYILTGLTHGAHLLKVLATTIVNDITIESNELISQILYAEEGVETPIVSSSFHKTEAVEGELLAIDYIIYDPLNVTASAYLQINDETPMEINVDRTKHYWNLTKYPIGDVVFKIGCRDVSIELPVSVEKLEMDIEPVTDDLVLHLSAANRSNAELSGVKEVWSYEDISCELQGLNWVSNGWINNALKLTGEATGYIPLEIFNADPRIVGKTIEIEFATHNIINYNSILLSCFTEDKGIQITATEAFLKSEQETVKVRFKEDEKVRLSFVIESNNDNKLIRTYVNGILSGIAQYDSSDNFQQGVPVGISLNEGHEEIDIYTIRVYDIALSSRQILNNYICDLTDVSEKIAEYQANNVYDLYGSISMAKIKSMIPILTITGELPPVKGTKKTVSTTYEDPLNPSLNFSTENCTIDIQGTSSQYYPKKNYKIKFPEPFSFYMGAIPEKEYTFKADYMESSHSHNTGNAILVNSLYDEMFPTQTAENGVRNTIYGFPCAIYYRATAANDYEYFGAYNFNNDKGNSDTLGLVGPKAQSWEFKNNTSTHCLLRNDDFSPEAKPEDDFEARYPDKYKDYTDLQRVVSWIVSTDGDLTKFKNEFNQHFNLHYCLIYYVMLEWGLMMDSRAKNMFFDTIDGNIWYPRMYDMDTCYGLNNEGVLNFGYGLEQHDEDIYNGENSLFWNNFEQVYAQEIKDMYLSLRASGKLSYDNMMRIFKENQIDKICEAQYNEDAKFKYLNPITENNDTTYLYAAQGNRLSHFQWWISNRIKYLDSKYEASDYLSDYITMRMYTETGNITITPYIDQYLKIKYGSADVKVRGVSGTPTLVPCPAGLTFNDTETIIYGANGISEIGDLSDKYPGTVDVSKGLKLSKLKIGSSAVNYVNTHLTTLTLGNNKLLRSIDVSNCPNLVGNLNVEGCIALREFKASGSGLRGISFVDGGDLEVLELPTTLTNLTIKNHRNLTQVTPSKFDNLQTLILKNSKLNASDILSTNYKSLTRIYCIFNQEANVELSMFILDYLLNNCNGVDDNGLNTPQPNLQGYISVTYPSTMSASAVAAMKERYATQLPYLTITYKPIATYFSYDSANNRVVFPVLNANLPVMTIIPDRDQIELALGLTPGTVNENTSFYSSNTTDSNYKNTLKFLVLPEGYSSYYIDMEYYDNIEKIILPKGPAKITYFALNDSYSPYAKHVEELDFSADNIDLSECTYFRFNPMGGSLKKLSFKNKTFNKSLNSSTSNGTFHNILYTSNTGTSPIEELNFDNIVVNSTNTYFGEMNSMSYARAYSSKGIHFLGRNMRLNNVTNFNFLNIGDMIEVDLSESYMPKVHTLSISSTSAYANAVKRLRTIKLNGMTMPNLATLNSAFSGNIQLRTIEMEGFGTTKVTNMSSAFASCEALTSLDLSSWNTGNVTNMTSMFEGCRKMESYNLEHFNTEKVTSMAEMFYVNSKLKHLDLTSFKVPKLTSVSYMIANCSALETVTWREPNSLAITNMSYMFHEDDSLKTVNMEGWDTSKVTTMVGMFRGCDSLEELNLDINLSKVTTTENMFNECPKINNITFTNNDAPALTTMAYMFRNCSSLEEIRMPGLIGAAVTNMNAAFQGCSSLRVLDLENFLATKVTNATSLFEKCKNLEVIRLGFNSQLTTMANMFNDCPKLTELSIPNLDTRAVTDMSYAFANNPNLEILNIGENFSTANATNLSYMFANTSKLKLPLDKIATSEAQNMAGMFQNCPLTQDDLNNIKAFDTAKTTNMSNLFDGCNLPEEIDLSGMDMTSVTNLDNMFANNPLVKSINVANMKYTPDANMWTLVSAMMTLPNLEKIDFSENGMSMTVSHSTNNYPNTINVYPNYTKLKEFIVPNLTFKIHCPANIFPNSPLEKIKIGYLYSGWSFHDYNRFEYRGLCKNKPTLKEVEITTMNFDHAKSNLKEMFYGCTGLTNFKLSTIDTTFNTDISYMFYNCASIENIDLSWMKTKMVTTMAYLFYGCSSLKTYNIDNFDYTNTDSIIYMFANCKSLESAKLKITNAPLLKHALYLFANCESLKTVDLTEANLSLVTSAEYWFTNCKSLKTLDLSYLNLNSITSAKGMFKGCIELEELNLSNFTFSKNFTCAEMFKDCISLKKLDIRNWQINKVSSGNYYSDFFSNVPNDCLIIVKDTSCRNWVQARKSTLNNVKLVSELEG